MHRTPALQFRWQQTSAVGVSSTSISGQGAGAVVTKAQLEKAKAAMRKSVDATRAQLRAPPEQTAADSLSEGSFDEVDEMVSQAEFSEDNDWRPLAGWFSVKPRQATLPTLGFAALRDKSIRWDRGYHVVEWQFRNLE